LSSVHARTSRAFCARSGKAFSVFPSDHAIFKVQAHFVCLHGGMIPNSGTRFSERIMPKQKSAQQHSGDWAMTGKVPVARVEGQELLPATIGRMKAIRNIKTMAGSPDADFAIDQRLAILRMVFLCRAFKASREPMKEDLNVQNSFSRNRLGWPSPQA
jgi:hypothetical protein